MEMGIANCKLQIENCKLKTMAALDPVPVSPRICNLQFAICNLKSRPGVTLMEVLISTFVLAVGLLGLAALLPVGRMAIVETMKADRSGDCGRAALRNIKARRLLDPYPWPPMPADPGRLNALVPQWLRPDGSDGAKWLSDQWPVGSFVIDPLGVSYRLAANESVPKFGGVIDRFTLAVPPWMDRSDPRFAKYGRMFNKEEAEKLFLWSDDLGYELPEDMDARLRPAGAVPMGRPWPTEPPRVPNTQPLLTSDGRYSWMITATLAPGEATWRLDPNAPPVDYNPNNQSRSRTNWVDSPPRWQRYTVSIVVFFARDPVTDDKVFSIQQNNFQDAITLADGGRIAVAGGSVIIDGSLKGLSTKLKENDWIALAAPAVPGKGTPPACRWYRVVAIGDGPASDKTNLVLAGPDWPIPPALTMAVIPSGNVAGVYTTVLEVDKDLTWHR
jgi:hypothetical protein